MALFRPISLDESNILNYKYRAIVFYLGTITTLMGLPMSSFEEIKEYAMAFFGFFIMVCMVISAASLHYATSTVYCLMDDFEEAIRKREFK